MAAPGGAIATALFIAPFGLEAGVTRWQQLWMQLEGVGFTMIYAPLVTIVLLFALRLVFGDLRVDPEGESVGLDQSEHSESAYVL